MIRIEDPINDVEELRALLKEKKGYQAVVGDYVYATIPHCGEAAFAQAEEQGWHHVHIFEGEDFTPVETLNGSATAVVFRRKAPEFYSWENPWLEKGPMPWLPNLDSRIPRKLQPLMETSAPHEGPCIVRRYRCGCGEKKVRIRHSPQMGRVEAACEECGDRRVLMDRKAIKSRDQGFLRPDEVRPEELVSVKCKCNTKLLSPLFVLEYTPEANEGWDFTWMKIIALCRNCGHSWFIGEIEV